MNLLGVSTSATDLGLFGDMVLVLSAAGLVAVVMHRFRLATIPAYLIAGALLGPGALGIIKSPEQVTRVAELAVILLMFGIGLHMDLKVISRGLGRVLIGTTLMSVISALLLLPLGLWWGLSVPSAIAAGLGLSLSSTVVVLRVLQGRRELGSTFGRISLAVLIVQDLLAIALLLLLPALARWNGTGSGGPVDLGPMNPGDSELTRKLLDALVDGGLAIGGVSLIVVIGRLVLPLILIEAAKTRSSEVLTVISMAAALVTAALTQMIGLNTALGAFLAGFLLASTPFRHQLGGQVGAIRDVFGAIFFTAVGMGVPVGLLISDAPAILIGLAAMLAVKFIVIAGVSWAVGATGNTALRVAMSLAQAGEFTILLLAAARAPDLGLLSDKQTGDLIAIVVLSLMVTPLMIELAARLAKRLPPIPTAKWNRVNALEDAPPVSMPGAEDGAAAASTRRRAIVAGYGLVGRAVADELKRMGFDCVIVEMNPQTVRKQSELGRRVVFGDISNLEVMESAGIHEAEALILTIPDEDSVMRACTLARALHPGIFIVVRMSYVSQGIAAAGSGASGVVVEEMATAEAMERMIKKALAAGQVGQGH